MRNKLIAVLSFTCLFPLAAQKAHLTAKQEQRQNYLQRWVMNNVEPWKTWEPSKFIAVLGPYEKRPSPEKPVWDAYYFPRADSTFLVPRQMNVMMLWRLGKATR